MATGDNVLLEFELPFRLPFSLVAKREKLIEKLLSGKSDANFPIADLMTLLEDLGFTRRQRGSHHIFTRPGVRERINLQSDGAKAKFISSARCATR